MMQRRVTAVLMSASGPGGEHGPSVCSVKGKPAFTQAVDFGFKVGLAEFEKSKRYGK